MSIAHQVLVLADVDAVALAWAGYFLSTSVLLLLLVAIYLELSRQHDPKNVGSPYESRRLLHALLCICLCLGIAGLLVNSHVTQTQAQRLRSAEAIAANAQNTVDREHRTLLALQKSLTLRDVRLPPEFDPALLRTINGINVELVSTHDPEPMKVADSIRSVVEFAGWHIVSNEQTDEPLEGGIRITTPSAPKENDKSIQARDAMLSILKDNLVPVTSESADLPPNTLRIEIGHHHRERSSMAASSK